MTILFLSSYSSSIVNEISKKKGYISYLIFPFIKVYKKSLLHIAKINDSKNSKLVLHIYDNYRNNDIYFIIKLLKYMYIKEQDINKKKWITNQLKKITCFQEYKTEFSSGSQTRIFMDGKEKLKSHALYKQTNIIPIYKIIIPKRNNLQAQNFNLALPSIENNKLASFNSKSVVSKCNFFKSNEKKFTKNIIRTNDKNDVFQYNYSLNNPDKLLLPYNLAFLNQNFGTKSLMFTKPDIKYMKRRGCIKNQNLYLINESSSKMSIIPTFTNVNLIHNKEKIAPPEEKYRSNNFQVKRISSNSSENRRGNEKWSNCEEHDSCSRGGHGETTWHKPTFANASNREKEIFENSLTQRIRLKGPLEYKLVD